MVYSILKSAITKLGNKIELIGEPFERNALVIGVFHGDEPQGKYLIERYLERSNGEIIAPFPQPSPSRGEGVVYKPPQYSLFAKTKSKEFRKNQTDAEQLLWYFLRAKRLNGMKFKRQQPIGNYVVDFVCFEKKLVIELDGGQHNEEKNIIKDKKRTEFLNLNGYKVLRFWNNEIFENIESCLEKIIDSDPLPPTRGRVRERGLLFIPCLNPDGMFQETRTNANGVDLNRNFPTKNWGEDTSAAGDNASDYFGGISAGSEIETQFVMEVIDKYKPEKILTLHAPYKVVNYDGPAQEWAEQISKIINYPVEASIGYPTPGSFGTYCGIERNIPTITLELDEKIPVEQLEQPVFEIFDELL